MMLLAQNSSFLSRILDSDIALDITLSGFLLIVFSSLFCGLVFGAVYLFNRRGELLTRGIGLALVVVPVATAVVVAMVGRNIATGLGLSGIFVLVRFRSGPVETKDLSYLFASICCGVLSGCGYVAYALIFAGIMLGVLVVLEHSTYGNEAASLMLLKIWVPEDLDFQQAFDPILKRYTRQYRLLMVKTTDFGALCELRYRIIPKRGMDQKKLIDAIRVKNGNMNVVLVVAPSVIEKSSRQVMG